MPKTLPKALSEADFLDLFDDRIVPIPDLPAGPARDLAARVNVPASAADTALRTSAEYSALFAELARAAPGEGKSLALTDPAGQPTRTGTAVAALAEAALDKSGFFTGPLYAADVSYWPEQADPVQDPRPPDPGGRLALWRLDPAERRHVPPETDVLYASPKFAMSNSGNRTLNAPKRSWKVELPGHGGDGQLVGMSRLNFKAMYNDPSQMREALAWQLFGELGLAAPRHTYAHLSINARYRGLFSLVEQVDRRMLRDHFGANDRGNLYKAYCGDLGCATLERRVGPDGDDRGRQYHTAGTNRTYRLTTNEDDPGSTYDDLAALIRAVDGTGLAGGHDRFTTDAYRHGLEAVFNVRAFLRWAAGNVLLGSWDNYFATPANYYLYNSGRDGDEHGYNTAPYFTFVPWDYDNSLGIDYFGTQWQYTALTDWPANTAGYCRQNFGGGTSRIPLVTNVLRNPDLCAYYLDAVEYLLEGPFAPEAVAGRIGSDDAGLWRRVSASAYLEADTPYSAPFTGRQFTNDQVYNAGCRQVELRQGNAVILGITNYVRMRYDSARDQLAGLRRTHAAGSGGGSFPPALEPLPGQGAGR